MDSKWIQGYASDGEHVGLTASTPDQASELRTASTKYAVWTSRVTQYMHIIREALTDNPKVWKPRLPYKVPLSLDKEVSLIVHRVRRLEKRLTYSMERRLTTPTAEISFPVTKMPLPANGHLARLSEATCYRQTLPDVWRRVNDRHGGELPPFDVRITRELDASISEWPVSADPGAGVTRTDAFSAPTGGVRRRDEDPGADTEDNETGVEVVQKPWYGILDRFALATDAHLERWLICTGELGEPSVHDRRVGFVSSLEVVARRVHSQFSQFPTRSPLLKGLPMLDTWCGSVRRVQGFHDCVRVRVQLKHLFLREKKCVKFGADGTEQSRDSFSSRGVCIQPQLLESAVRDEPLVIARLFYNEAKNRWKVKGFLACGDVEPEAEGPWWLDPPEAKGPWWLDPLEDLDSVDSLYPCSGVVIRSGLKPRPMKGDEPVRMLPLSLQDDALRFGNEQRWSGFFRGLRPMDHDLELPMPTAARH